MPYREFRDKQGREWRAWDTYPYQQNAVAAGFSEGWLCFESELGKRRLAPVPEQWDAAPEERLRLLLQMAEEARPPRVHDAPVPSGEVPVD